MPERRDEKRPIAEQNERDPHADTRRKSHDEEREALQQQLTPPFGKRKVPEPPQ